MNEEKKVLTPEEIADEISLMADFNTVESNKKHHIELKSKIERLIREYGEQQYTLGSHALFKEIAVNSQQYNDEF